ncbi:GTP pyrophosphokinase family protein [Clostridium sp. BJN0001]|uniref:GTP pyrophosphokinase n=1 Tax=Clostridium sp. BJN0001 TaxID=2930219 RepID=UPI002467AF04|nr:GTP pyrophosphokinase family protein [Clostridium sp. BJN0001]
MTQQYEEKFDEIERISMIYRSAIKEISTKISVLNDEFSVDRKRNPIEYIKTRVKSPKSIMGKLERKGFEMTMRSAMQNLNDIAGIRVICSFVSDIYEIADLLINQDDITLIQKKDYIKNPKKNGYRSLHLVLEVPVFFSDSVKPIRAEVQIRTIAMDFWASLEHKLYYKTEIGEDTSYIRKELKECADVISSTDLKMLEIQKEVEKIGSK